MPTESFPHPPDPAEEMRGLVNELYDGRISDTGLCRMQELLLSDQTCLQAYIEQLDFHCELIDQADQTPSEAAVLIGMQRYSQASAVRKSRTQLRLNFVIVASLLFVLLGVGWMFSAVVWAPPEVGMIVSLSTGVQSTPLLELGQIVRRGEKFHVTQGVVSLQLPSVVVDIIAPATLTWNSARQLMLQHGTVVAQVEPAGRGFTVSTPNGEVVDLGTEFLVNHETGKGTYVSVRRGRAQAKLLDWRGVSTKVVELTASRAARIESSSRTVREIAYAPEQYRPVHRFRAGIHRISGAIRTAEDVPPSLESDQLTTPNHMLVIPEGQSIVLDAPLVVESVTGPVTLPQGAVVSSYLIHYDPTDKVSFAPRGAVTFHGKIAAVVGTSQGLTQTDPVFGLPGIVMESAKFRELELDEDEIQISDDRQTVSFFWGVSPPEFLDEARILVVDTELSM